MLRTRRLRGHCGARTAAPRARARARGGARRPTLRARERSRCRAAGAGSSGTAISGTGLLAEPNATGGSSRSSACEAGTTGVFRLDLAGFPRVTGGVTRLPRRADRTGRRVEVATAAQAVSKRLRLPMTPGAFGERLRSEPAPSWRSGDERRARQSPVAAAAPWDGRPASGGPAWGRASEPASDQAPAAAARAPSRPSWWSARSAGESPARPPARSRARAGRARRGVS